MSAPFSVYEHELHRYQQIVRQRNQLLKFHREKILNSPELESWNEQLAKQGARVIEKRMFATHRIGLLARLAHRSLTGRDETLDVEYLSSIPKELDTQASETEMALLQGLKEKGKHEARVGQTLLGPHRDDILFSINKKNARLFASQGQQRTLVLALKLAELEFIKGESGEFPILLFDDVFSELDDKRRRLLVETIEGRVQTLITGTAAERLGVFKSAGKIFTVHGGEVKLFDSHSSTTR
ncbi:MAG: DNA replication and repair protein RecF [Firmicutes bacterium]|nr:DNA replication and repair protein RecF [Bacillota bacterium]